ncbi:PE-PPE domain-containing protein [Mycobacterium sp. NPDC050551]|uniref:PE-PPE domain-containing protein n=1 Tax=Mycobacterium sp. NPDC050551 TaxID=3155407 RepID=UPI00341BD501
MAKHRVKSGRRGSGRVGPVVVGGAAVVTAAAVSGVAVTAPGSVAAPNVELAALVIEGSSTNPTGDGIRAFYGNKFDRPDVTQVSFFTGPFGVYDALKANSGEDNVVLSSGWGAANVSLLLSYLEATNSADPDLTTPLYILDNNVARPNGGFGTRYPVFAVIGVNPIPTPEQPGVKVVDVGYEYDINGNTPAYVLNPVAMANSLATYFDNRLNQNEVNLPVDENGDLDYTDTNCDAACQSEVADGAEREFTLQTGETVRVKKVEGTTYISYRTDGLPLLQPLRQYGGEPGDRFADAVEPALKAAVDYGYPDNDALANPDRYEPARLVPTAKETQTFARDFNQGVRDGLGTLDDAPDTTAGRTTTPRTSQLVTKKATPQIEESTDPSPTKAGQRKRSSDPVGSAIKRTIHRLTKPSRVKNDSDTDAPSEKDSSPDE